MRFGGEAVQALATDEVIIPRPDGSHLVFKVRAMCHGEEGDIFQIIPDVEPPYNFLKDDKGLPLRDENGKQVHGPILDDPGYIKHQQDAEDLRVVAKIVRSLDRDERVTWETTAAKDTRAFYVDIFVEIKAAGFSFGDLAIIIRKVNELSNVDGGIIERVAEAFLSREQAKVNQ